MLAKSATFLPSLRMNHLRRHWWTSTVVVSALQVQRAIELRNIVTSLGPAFIKLGQV